MPRHRSLSSEEKLGRREALAEKAAAGELRLPGAIREIREALGLTQAAFGLRFGLTRLQVIALESGAANPTQATLSRVGKPFGFVLGFVPRARDEPPPRDKAPSAKCEAAIAGYLPTGAPATGACRFAEHQPPVTRPRAAL